LKTIFLLIASFILINAKANNVQIANIQVDERRLVHFTLSWENAWNLADEIPNNNDAIWLFIKIREKGKEWQSINLKDTYGWLSLNGTFILQEADNGAGLIIKASENGQWSKIEEQLQFHFDAFPAEFEIKIFAIEMVYVPQAAYFLGDGVSLNCLGDLLNGKPVYIQSENALNLKVNDGQDSAISVSSLYPKGYNSFYAMKYEISQQQYVDFLNCLNFEAQSNRTEQSPYSVSGTWAMAYSNESRNGIVVSVSGIYPDKAAVYECNANANSLFSEPEDAQNRAMNYLSYGDLAAYLDWAGLRPLSELEFEKLARGPKEPVGGEMAWGSIYSVSADNVIFDGTDLEAVSEQGNDTAGLANYGYNQLQGPFRSGFAGTENTNRVSAGAGYYGAFDLSGNVWEILIAANFSGFEGKSGDAHLDEQGNSNQLDWPSIDALGTIYRGGAWNSGVYEVGNWRDLAISDRYYYNLIADTRRNTTGGRGGITWKN
jgi:formylglycine-generating enzyme required for sulfatase activity